MLNHYSLVHFIGEESEQYQEADELAELSTTRSYRKLVNGIAVCHHRLSCNVESKSKPLAVMVCMCLAHGLPLLARVALLE